MTGENSKVDITDLPVLECKREVPSEAQGELLTVGSLIKLECTSKSFILNPSQLKFTTEMPYQLQILDSEMQPDGRIILKVTSYRVGEFNSDKVILSDGINQMAVSGIQFKVESVIDPKNPPKGPYGPFGGFVLTLPPFYFWSLLGTFFLFLLYGSFKFYRRWQKKKLIDGLKKHDIRLSPQTQLHVRFRQLERLRSNNKETVEKQIIDMEDILRVFIIRQFKIPAHDWSDRLILNEFQSRFAFLGKEMTKELRVLLRETKKARTLKNPQSKDMEQLIKKIKRWADQIDRLSSSQARRRPEVSL